MVAWGDAGGHDGPGDAPTERSTSEPGARPRPVRDDEAMHPARHLRRGQWGPMANPFQAWEAPSRGAAPAPGSVRAGGRRKPSVESGAGAVGVPASTSGGVGRPTRRGRGKPLMAGVGAGGGGG